MAAISSTYLLNLFSDEFRQDLKLMESSEFQEYLSHSGQGDIRMKIIDMIRFIERKQHVEALATMSEVRMHFSRPIRVDYTINDNQRVKHIVVPPEESFVEDYIAIERRGYFYPLSAQSIYVKIDGSDRLKAEIMPDQNNPNRALIRIRPVDESKRIQYVMCRLNIELGLLAQRVDIYILQKTEHLNDEYALPYRSLHELKRELESNSSLKVAFFKEYSQQSKQLQKWLEQMGLDENLYQAVLRSGAIDKASLFFCIMGVKEAGSSKFLKIPTYQKTAANHKTYRHILRYFPLQRRKKINLFKTISRTGIIYPAHSHNNQIRVLSEKMGRLKIYASRKAHGFVYVAGSKQSHIVEIRPASAIPISIEDIFGSPRGRGKLRAFALVLLSVVFLLGAQMQFRAIWDNVAYNSEIYKSILAQGNSDLADGALEKQNLNFDEQPLLAFTHASVYSQTQWKEADERFLSFVESLSRQMKQDFPNRKIVWTVDKNRGCKISVDGFFTKHVYEALAQSIQRELIRQKIERAIDLWILVSVDKDDFAERVFHTRRNLSIEVYNVFLAELQGSKATVRFRSESGQTGLVSIWIDKQSFL